MKTIFSPKDKQQVLLGYGLFLNLINLVVLLGPRRILGWYEACIYIYIYIYTLDIEINIKIDIRLILPSVPYKTSYVHYWAVLL
jgi:hypothetical protein